MQHAFDLPRPPAPTPHAPALTSREREAVDMLSRGHTQKEAAYEMGIAASTFRVLLLRATRKLRGALVQSHVAS